MSDREVSLTSLLAWSAWVLAVALVGVTLIPDVPVAVGLFGPVLAVAGGTLHVRKFMIGLHLREMAAFDLGRESVRTLR